MHELHAKVGEELSSVLPALHSIIGCDVTSKVGTKKSAIKAEPEKYVTKFGTCPLSQSIVKRAEQFLVKTLKKTTKKRHFKELRADLFYSSKKWFSL